MAEEEFASRRELGSSWSKKTSASEKSSIFYNEIEKNVIANFDLIWPYARRKRSCVDQNRINAFSTHWYTIQSILEIVQNM